MCLSIIKVHFSDLASDVVFPGAFLRVPSLVDCLPTLSAILDRLGAFSLAPLLDAHFCCNDVRVAFEDQLSEMPAASGAGQQHFQTDPGQLVVDRALILQHAQLAPEIRVSLSEPYALVCSGTPVSLWGSGEGLVFDYTDRNHDKSVVFSHLQRVPLASCQICQWGLIRRAELTSIFSILDTNLQSIFRLWMQMFALPRLWQEHLASGRKIF